MIRNPKTYFIVLCLLLVIAWVVIDPISDQKSRDASSAGQTVELAETEIERASTEPAKSSNQEEESTRPEIAAEQISATHWREARLEQIPGLPYPVRTEEVFHIDEYGERHLKSSVSYVASQVLVALTTNEIPEVLSAIGVLRPLKSHESARTYLLEISDWDLESVPDLLDLFDAEPYRSWIRFIEPDYIISSHRLPDDPLLLSGDQWGLYRTDGITIGTETGWDTITDADDVTVAILDSGIQTDHVDLAANLWANPNEVVGNDIDDDTNGWVDDIHGVNTILESTLIDDDDGHGTHVAGVIGAAGNNSEGIAGVAWSTRLLTVKILGADGRGTVSDAVEGLEYAVAAGADIINASWGNYGFSQTLFDAVSDARDAGIIVVASSGNDSGNNDLEPNYPASYSLDNVVSVASISEGGFLSGFSNYGRSSVDIAAPGSDILSTWPFGDSDYSTLSGTSMAAPFVSGTLALLKQQFPGENSADHLSRLFLGHETLAELEGRIRYGGIPNLGKALLIEEPDSGFQIFRRLEEQYIRFAGQSLQLGPDFINTEGVQFQWYQDGQILADQIDGELVIEAVSRSDAGTYKLVAQKGDIELTDVTELVIPERNPRLRTAADTFLEIGSSQAAPWTVTEEFAQTQSSSLASAAIEDDQSTSFYTFVEGEGTLTFFYKVSSEENYDLLTVWVDGELQYSDSGEVDWSRVDLSVSGSQIHYVEWRYTKDRNGAAGLDAAFVDNIQWRSPNANTPFIEVQPVSRTLPEGESVALSVVASGEDLKYQWSKGGSLLIGETNATLSFNSLTVDDTGFYGVEVYNGFGSDRSDLAELKVGDFPVEITRHPSSVTTREGRNVRFEVEATGTEPLEYRWFKDDVEITWAASPDFVIDPVGLDDEGGYSVRVSNPVSTNGVFSDAATLIVLPRITVPSIIKQTGNVNVFLGDAYTFSVTASGTAPLSYQWYFEGEPIPGAIGSRLLISPVEEADLGNYRCEVSNPYGSTLSQPMELSIVGDIGGAFELPGLGWAFNRPDKVRIQSDVSYDGIDALEISSDQAEGPTYISAYLEGPVELSFKHFLNGSSSDAKLHVILNDAVFRTDISPGFFDWETYEMSVDESGTHELRIVVTSTEGVSPLYIDAFEINYLPRYGLFGDGAGASVGDPLFLEIPVLSVEPYELTWLKDGDVLAGQNESRIDLAEVQLADAGLYQLQCTNPYGSSISEGIEVVVFEEGLHVSLDTEDYNFRVLEGGFWFPQSEKVFEGDSAPQTPETSEGASVLGATIQGPATIQFVSDFLSFTVDDEYRSPETYGGEWDDWTIYLYEDREYELKWTHIVDFPVRPGILDAFRVAPLFYFIEPPSTNIDIYERETITLEPEFVGSGYSFQWYKNEVLAPGETGEGIQLSYDTVESGDTYYLHASRNGVLVTMGYSISKQLGPRPANDTFFSEGLQFFTDGSGPWGRSQAEPTASGRRSLSPGSIPENYIDNRWHSTASFPLSGTGEVSFRYKNFDDYGIVGHDYIDQPYYGPAVLPYSEDWVTYSVKQRNPDLDRFYFFYWQSSPFRFGEIPIYLDNIVYRKMPVLEERIPDLYITLGSPLNLSLDVAPIPTAPVSSKVYKGSELLWESGSDAAFSIDSISESDAGDYQVTLEDQEGRLGLEPFKIVPQPPIASIMDSTRESFTLSHPDDWDVVVLDETSGNEGLVANLDRFGLTYSENIFERAEVSLSSLIEGPGSLNIRFKLDGWFSRPEMQVYLDGESFFSNTTDEDGFYVIEREFNEDDVREIELLFVFQPQFGNQPPQIIVDSFFFEPVQSFTGYPTSLIRYPGDSVEFEISTSNYLGSPVSYSWYRNDDLLQTGSSGNFVIDSLEETDFTEYRLEIDSEINGLEVVPFSIFDASLINEGINQPGLSFEGWITGQAELAIGSEPGYDNHLQVRRSETGDIFQGEFSCIVEGPFTIRFDTQSIFENFAVFPLPVRYASTSFRIGRDFLRVYSPGTSGWERFEVSIDEPGFHELVWTFESEGGQSESVLSLGNMEIIQTPTFDIDTSDRSALSGSPFVLGARVPSTKELTFEWLKDGQVLEGVTEPYIVKTSSGLADAGTYQLRATNKFGTAVSDPFVVEVRDDYNDAFPFQSWQRSVTEADYLSVETTDELDSGSLIKFVPTKDRERSPALNFSLLGPRRIELLAKVDDSVANYFSIEVNNGRLRSGLATATGWGTTLLDAGFGIMDVSVAFNSEWQPSTETFDDSLGCVGAIKVSWLDDHPFTDWLKWSLPYDYRTISDLDLIFGDVDGDGVSNFLEYATLSSATVAGSSVSIATGEDGRQENISFFRGPQPFPAWFRYDLEISSDLVEWQRIQSEETITTNPENRDVEYVTLSPAEDVELPPGDCFLRLVVSTDFYLPDSSGF